ncbi:MAG: purine-cytosine permease family protein [Opitutales bacterium]
MSDLPPPTHESPSAAVSNEYERERVPDGKLKGANKFWGMYAGEHAAGTEFMIGPLFLLNGVSLQNIILGLLFGNLLAVLSWRYLCTPIAVQARYTLYYHLEKIAGVQLVKLFNLANGILFCFLAGAMITVSATAVGIPVNMPMPGIEDWYPNSTSFVVIVLLVGLVISIVASLGYETVAKFANIASPWMVLVFAACGLIAFKELGVTNWDALGRVWTESIMVAQGGAAESKMGFWSVAFFAWFCNAAMHVGMADLSVFRFAKKSSYGWASSAGMYVGHYMAWIAAALMLAVQIKATGNTNPVPGPMANQVAGLAGIICVIVAGWTTANPTIYRAGLAFQAILPKASRMKVTFAAGMVATIAGVFPAFAWKLLTFVGLYGTILAPMGAVIFFDWYFQQKADSNRFDASRFGGSVNPAVLLAWLLPVAVALYCIQFKGMAAWYFPLPCWIGCGLLYLLFTKMLRKEAA